MIFWLPLLSSIKDSFESNFLLLAYAVNLSDHDVKMQMYQVLTQFIHNYNEAGIEPRIILNYNK